MEYLRYLSLAIAVIMTVTAHAASAEVTITSWVLNNRAADFVDGPGEVVDEVTSVVMPFNDTRQAVAGMSNSSSIYAFNNTAAGATFRADFTHTRDGDGPASGLGLGDRASSRVRIEFDLIEPMHYSIDGVYALQGASLIFMHAGITSLPTQAEVFTNYQQSIMTPNQQLVIGQQGGTQFNQLIGQRSGVLNPGSYIFNLYYEIAIAAGTGGVPVSPGLEDGGATASGWMTLHLTPEPTSALALLALLSSCLLRRTRC